MGNRDELLRPTECGLCCTAGGFHVDPWRPVERAVVTHAHSDHCAYGCGEYVCSASCVGVLRERVGPAARITGVRYGEVVTAGDVRVSLHPAGHILGSAQVRVERAGGDRAGETWVVSGDYKTTKDPTAEHFEPVRCDVFITESTFGLPIYRWPDEREVFGQVNAWWRANAAAGRTSMVFAYALGKAQRVLAGIDASIGPIAVHGAVARFDRAYRAAGVVLPEAPHAVGDVVQRVKGVGLVVAPPSALGSPWVRKFAGKEGFSGAFVSGWMRVRGTRRRKAVDRGFVLSDHADWPGLLQTIEATGAERVGVTHGYIGPLVRWLRENGRDAFAVPTRYTGETGEEADADPAETADEAPTLDGIAPSGEVPS